MHELAYAQAILKVAVDVAQGRRVQRVQIHVGDMHAIVPESLQFCFQVAARDTLAADAQLELTPVSGDAFSVEAVLVDEAWLQHPVS